MGHQVVGDDDDLLRAHGVRESVAQGTAGGLADLAGHVAHGIRGRRRDEGDVDGRDALDDVGGSAAVGAELHRLFQDPFGDLGADAAAHVVGDQLGDDAVSDVIRQGQMAVEQGAGIDGDILIAHGRDLVHDHVQHVVSVAQVMVEGDAAAVLDAGQLNGFAERFYYFIHAKPPLFPGRGRRPCRWSAALWPRWERRSSCRAGRRRLCPAPCRCGWLPSLRRRNRYPSVWG